MARRAPCLIRWSSNGRRVKATTVRRAMGSAYDIMAMDICRHGPSTIPAGGKRFYGEPVRRRKYRRR